MGQEIPAKMQFPVFLKEKARMTIADCYGGDRAVKNAIPSTQKSLDGNPRRLQHFALIHLNQRNSTTPYTASLPAMPFALRPTHNSVRIQDLAI